MSRSLLLGALVAVAVAGCTLKKASSSAVKHDVGKPTNDASESRQWRQVTMEEYIKTLGPQAMFWKALDSTDARTVRAQYWLDKIDSTLRAEYPEMKNIPKPEAVVFDSDKLNAFVASTAVCLNIGFKGADSSAEKVDAVIFRRRNMKIEKYSRECLSSNMDAKAEREFLTWWAKAFTGCDLTIDDAGVASVGGGCDKYLTKPIGQANKIVLHQTTSKVGFFAGNFTKMSEGEFVSVVAHELGHYYKSHVSAAGNEYNFFYKMDTVHPTSRPKADESLRPFGEQVLELNSELTRVDLSFDAADMAARARVLSTMNKAIEMNLAHYTTEQEADELAMEWLSKIGVDPSYGIDAQFLLADIAGDKRGLAGWMDANTCKSAYEKGWKDEKGNTIMVPVADWEVHHSPCFRAFNMDREIKAHKYPNFNKSIVGPEPAWSSFKEVAP